MTESFDLVSSTLLKLAPERGLTPLFFVERFLVPTEEISLRPSMSWIRSLTDVDGGGRSMTSLLAMIDELN